MQAVELNNRFVSPLVRDYILRNLASLSKDVFERRRSTGSEAFSFLIYLDASKCVFVSVYDCTENLDILLNYSYYSYSTHTTHTTQACKTSTSG